MKRSYLFLTIAILSLIGCKKDNLVTENPNTTKIDDYTICADDNWGGYYDFKGHIPSFIFVYNDKAYVPRDHGMGLPGDRRVYIFDGSVWTDIATNTPHTTDQFDAAFTIGSKGYVIFTNGAQHARKFYEYNLLTNVWTRKADFPGESGGNSATFTIGNKGYIVGGDYFGDYTNETWEYNPATNAWRERKSLLLSTSFAIGFSVDSKGYLTHGRNVFGYNNSLQEYDPATNDWTSKAGFPGAGRIRSQSFVVNNNGYAGGGTNGPDQLLDFYKYTPASNSWTRVDDIPPANYLHNSFSLNEKGYVVHYGPNGNTLVRYNPKYCTTIQTGNVMNLNN
jgi:N-acetylneuraminic acid mutarotase